MGNNDPSDIYSNGKLNKNLSFLDPAGFLSGKDEVDTSSTTNEAARTRALSEGFGTERSGYVPQTGAQDQTRAQQQQSLAGLQAAAAGTAPSAAELQLKTQSGVDAARQYGLAAALRGHSVGSALRQAGEGAATIAGQTNQQAGVLRAGEQAAARGQLSSALQGVRGQDITQQQTNDDWRKALLSAQLTASGQSAGTIQALQAAEAARAAAATQKQGAFMGAGGSLIGALSDSRAKKDVRKRSLADALSETVHGVEYTYKRGHADSAKHFGVMAQDLERVVPGVVAKGKDGLRRVDTAHLSLGNTAMISELAGRLRALEGTKGG